MQSAALDRILSSSVEAWPATALPTWIRPAKRVADVIGSGTALGTQAVELIDIAPDGYSLQTLIYRGPHARVCRGRRERDDRPVILKLPHTVLGQPVDGARLAHEFDVLRGLRISGTPRVYALIQEEDSAILVFEDTGGASLIDLDLCGKIDLGMFLELALEVTVTLEQLHRHEIVHGAISPAHIVVSP